MASRKIASPAVAASNQDAPLPLITVDAKGKFVIGAEAANLIRHINGDVAVVSVAGLYRYVLLTIPIFEARGASDVHRNFKSGV